VVGISDFGECPACASRAGGNFSATNFAYRRFGHAEGFHLTVVRPVVCRPDSFAASSRSLNGGPSVSHWGRHAPSVAGPGEERDLSIKVDLFTSFLRPTSFYSCIECAECVPAGILICISAWERQQLRDGNDFADLSYEGQSRKATRSSRAGEQRPQRKEMRECHNFRRSRCSKERTSVRCDVNLPKTALSSCANARLHANQPFGNIDKKP